MDRVRRRRVIAAGLLLSSLGSAPPVVAVDFSGSLETARQVDARRPVVLTFTSPSCGWCRKLEATTFSDPRIEALQDEYLWVKLNVDEHPALAARLQVRGVPHTFVLDEQDRPIGSRPGYMPAEDFARFLAAAVANPQPIDVAPAELLERLAHPQDESELREAVRTAVLRLSTTSAVDRDRLLASLKVAGPSARLELATLLADERLAVRAAAAGSLQKLTGADLPFDPFADEATRSRQVEVWRKRLAESTPERPSQN